MAHDEFTAIRRLKNRLAELKTEEADEIKNAPESIRQRFAKKRRDAIGALSREAADSAAKLGIITPAEVEAIVGASGKGAA